MHWKWARGWHLEITCMDKALLYNITKWVSFSAFKLQSAPTHWLVLNNKYKKLVWVSSDNMTPDGSKTRSILVFFVIIKLVFDSFCNNVIIWKEFCLNKKIISFWKSEKFEWDFLKPLWQFFPDFWHTLPHVGSVLVHPLAILTNFWPLSLS